jgi:hypothetical protein
MYRIEIWRNAAFFLYLTIWRTGKNIGEMELNGKMCVRCVKPVQKDGSTNEERIAPRKNGGCPRKNIPK